MTGLIQQVLRGALEAEVTDHLGYEPYEAKGRGSPNSRNGTYAKTVRTEIGDVRVGVPRDRNGSFEPVTVPVGQRRLSGLDGRKRFDGDFALWERFDDWGHRRLS